MKENGEEPGESGKADFHRDLILCERERERSLDGSFLDWGSSIRSPGHS